MTTAQAKKIRDDFAQMTNPDREQFFVFSEAMDLLISTEHNPQDMMLLGGVYYEMRDFNLALKYYEMAAAYDFNDAYMGLGYIWYYGRTGKVDYKKAFEYYSKAQKNGDIVAEYKIADMYKNGYYVEKSYDKYCEIIESLYDRVKDTRKLYAPLPEIFTRLANIRKKQGDSDSALDLFYYARDFLAQRIKYSPFFGNLNIMKWMIDDIYSIINFDYDWFDFYDLYYLLKKPVCIIFSFEDKVYEITVTDKDGETAISFNGKWYRTVDDFFAKAQLDGRLLTSIYNDLYDFEVK